MAEIRKAITSHHTSVVDKPWDGPKMVARLKNDADASYYKKMFAWYDPEGNPKAKSSYKFPHHMVDENGNIGAANVRGCIAGIAVLNGARGGANIPSSDRKPVWNHLATHLKDAGYTPPELKAEGTEVERRSYPTEMVVSTRDDGRERIVGHAAVFGKLSVPLLGYRERIRKGAFSDAIKNDDIRALWNHNPDYVLGRNKSGTLKLQEDEIGLKVEIIPPDTQWAEDLIKSIKRGDVDQMSFGFKVMDEEWKKENGENIRELVKVKLFDVSPVTFPAYPQTDVSVRSFLEDIGIDFDKLVFALKNPAQESGYIRKVIGILEGCIPQERDINILRKKLELIEKL